MTAATGDRLAGLAELWDGWAPGPLPPTDFSAVLDRLPELRQVYQAVGRTPLTEVPGPDGGARIYAKQEWRNPFGSIKDRVAIALICALLNDRPDTTDFIEYSGGNLAVALGHLGRITGLRPHLALSSATSGRVVKELRAGGAEVILCDKDRGFAHVVTTAIDIAATHPEWPFLHQHANDVNLAFHRATTGAEAVAQLAGKAPAAWVASIGTGGTLIGVLLALREVFGEVAAIGVTPAELPYGSSEPPNGLPKYAGSGGIGCGIRQPFVRSYEEHVSEHRSVDLLSCHAAMARFLGLTGIRIGTSAAANWLVASQVAAGLPASEVVVTIFPDAGWPEEWERVPGQEPMP